MSIAAVEPTSSLGLLPACRADDYLVVDAQMPVGHVVRPGQSLAFGGAAIGFRTSAANQDGCKIARVVLRYISS